MKKEKSLSEIKQKSDKIFRRLSKEAGVFPGKAYKHICEFIKNNNSYVFYGLDDFHYSRYGIEYEIIFYTLQLDLAKVLIDNGLLTQDDCRKIYTDTIRRYNVTGVLSDDWREVAIASDKRKFVEFFIPYFEQHFTKLNGAEKRIIYSGLPMK